MINFKTNDENERKQAHNYVDQAFDNQDNLFIMISNGIKVKTNTKDKKMTFDEKKLAEIIVATVQPMLDKALEPIKKDISDIKTRLGVLEREASKHGWDLSVK